MCIGSEQLKVMVIRGMQIGSHMHYKTINAVASGPSHVVLCVFMFTLSQHSESTTSPVYSNTQHPVLAVLPLTMHP